MKKNNKFILLNFVLIFFSVQTSFAMSETDTLIIPACEMYKNTWGGECTRLKTDMLDKKQNYILPLQTENDNTFVFPTKNKTYVCSPYGIRSGKMHTGMDMKQKLGDSIVAAWDGVVRMAKKNYYGYGGTVVIRHKNGLETLYAHLSSLNVEENQVVKAGELIGLAGRTGRATTEHLHFETRFLYEYFDPRIIIDFNTFSLISDTLFISKGKYLNGAKFINNNQFTEKLEDDTTFIIDNLPQKDNQPIKETETKTVNQQSLDIYIVKKGDTLYSIAKKNNVNIDYLCRLNKITQESILQIGQKLKLE